jgi:anti-anti-sigma regulatory factor
MLRITQDRENGNVVRLRLDGTITPETFGEIEQACARHRRGNGHVIIFDMAGVTFMNDEAANKLARLSGNALRIINCSPFIAALLETAGGSD